MGPVQQRSDLPARLVDLVGGAACVEDVRTTSELLQHAPLAVFVVDAHLRLRMVNRKAEALFADLDSQIGPQVGGDLAAVAAAIWTPPTAAAALDEFRRTLATGVPYTAPLTPDGTAGRMAAFDWQLQRTMLPDGTRGVVCYAYDLTPVRAEQVQRLDHEARLSRALDVSELGTFVWHIDARRGDPDPRALELCGLGGRDASLETAVAALIHPDDRRRAASAIARALDPDGDGTIHEDLRIRRPDGVRWLAVTARTTFDGEPRRAVRVAGVIADIDARKRAEAELLARDQQLTGASQRKDEFLAVLAHELRNPLAPIRAGLELIRLQGGNERAVEQTRTMMERQVGHMIRLIDDLLDVSRITSGKLHLQRRPTPLETLIGTAVDANRQAVAGAQLSLETSLPDTPIWLDVDPTRAVQIVSNLLHNAVKFTDAGGRIMLSAAIDPDVPRMLALTIADSGVGITAEMLPHVFDLFRQDSAASTRAHVGLGIGLALARRLVELHGGTIEARSDGPGRGSAFTIRLPIVDAPSAPGPAALAPGAGPRTRHRVVVIDDNLDAANAMAMLVEALGADARVAGDGTSGLEQVLAWKPTLVLLDIGMPGMDGYDTCRRIRQAVGSAVTVVAVTGWGQEHDKRLARHAGFDAHLTKPAEPAAVQQLLADPPQER